MSPETHPALPHRHWPPLAWHLAVAAFVIFWYAI